MKRLLLVSLLVLTLAACDSAKERAQKHYQAAVTLIDAGDLDRGLVELRNVFKLDNQHHDARRLFADTLRKKGDMPGAYGQYLKLVEQYPDDTDGLKALAEIAFASGDPTETRARVDAALARLPADDSLKAMDAALNYRTAAQASDADAKAKAVAAARLLEAKDPALLPARQVVVADLIAGQEWDKALSELDAGLKLDPASRVLHAMRLGVLQQLGDKAGIETELKQMVVLFPNDPAIGATLVRWYVSEKRLDDAEAWLRGRITEGITDAEPRLTLVRFLAELRGADAALAELDRILALDPPPPDVAANLAAFRSLHAGFLFTAGKHDAAMTELEALLNDAPASDQTNRIKVALARMRATTGNQVGARALVEEVLAADPNQVDAMKLKGNWLIEDDKTDDAVALLRAALGNAPQDTDIMTLLARAYERQGNHQLIGDMLSRAVQASNKAPQESLRYATFLMRDNQFRSAEDVLLDALRMAPGDVDLTAAIAQAHIGMQDWPRAQRDIDSLREIGTPPATAAADELKARMLAGQGKSDEMTAFLESLATSGKGGIGPEAAVIRALLVAGNIDSALSRAQALAAAHPDDQDAQFVLASVLALADKSDEAEGLLRHVVAASPQFERAWTALYGILSKKGDLDGAAAVLDTAQQALPDSATLKWSRAGLLERRGDVDGAIRIYEDLYAGNSNSAVIANNLASLLASTRDDKDSLDRAWTVARRLKGTEVPAFADTYGWIAFRRGDLTEALGNLEMAAKGLPLDPTVQYHLGEVYAGLKRTDDARTQFDRAGDLLKQGQQGIPGLDKLLETATAGLGGE